MTNVLKAKKATSDHRLRAPAVSAPPETRRAARRPTRAEGQEIYQAILSAALEEFLARGFNGARMDAIATTANITRASLYGRFATKEALFQRIVDEHSKTWTVESYIAPPTDDSLRERLRSRARGFAKVLTAPGSQTYQHLLNAAQHGYPSFPALMYERGFLPFRDDFAEDILAGAEGGLTTPQAASDAAELLIVSIYGWFIVEGASGALSLDRALAFADRAVEAAMASLRP